MSGIELGASESGLAGFHPTQPVTAASTNDRFGETVPIL
jgi:hypothetical protein